MGNPEVSGIETRKPEEIYVGKAGYELMLSEIRESLYEQIPDARGSIEIFNHVADPDTEVQRIASSLRLSTEDLYKAFDYDDYDSFKSDLNGQMIHTTLDDGRYIAISAAWDPDYRYSDLDDITFDDIHTYARIITHETLHALDPYIQEHDAEYHGPNGWIIAGLTNSRAHEMFADVGAQDLLLRNGDTPEATQGLIVSYDSEASTRENPRYDNGPFIQAVLDDHPQGKGLTSFRLEGWEETIHKVSALRKNGPVEISIGSTLRAHAQNNAFREQKERTLDDLKETIAPFKEMLTEEFGVTNYDKFIENLYDDMDFQRWANRDENSLYSGPHLILLQSVYDAKVNTAEWMEENKDIFPDAARVAAAIRHLTRSPEDADAQYISVGPQPTSELTNDMLMARSWLKYRETQDELYSEAALEYGSTMELYEHQVHKNSGTTGSAQVLDRRDIIEQLFQSNPQLPQALAQGIPLKDIVNVDFGDPDDYQDDTYTLAENFDDVVNRHNNAANDTEPNAADSPILTTPITPATIK